MLDDHLAAAASPDDAAAAASSAAAGILAPPAPSDSPGTPVHSDEDSRGQRE